MHEQFLCGEEVENHIHMQLLKRGYAPGAKEVEDLTDIVWEYLIDLGVLIEY